MRNIRTLVVAALVGYAYLGAPTPAHAAFNIYLDSGSGQTLVATGNADFGIASFSGTYNGFVVKVLAATSDNGATLSDLQSSTLSVQNTNASTKTLTVTVTQTNYSLPAGTPLFVESGLSGSISSGTLGMTGIFQAYADKNNAVQGTGGFTNGVQNGIQSGSTYDTGSKIGLFNRTAGSPYSLTTVSTLMMSAGGKVNLSSTVNVTPVPAPAGVVLALSSLPFLGIGTWLRRRRAMASDC